jgi:hypothetical protein
MEAVVMARTHPHSVTFERIAYRFRGMDDAQRIAELEELLHVDQSEDKELVKARLDFNAHLCTVLEASKVYPVRKPKAAA